MIRFLYTLDYDDHRFASTAAQTDPCTPDSGPPTAATSNGVNAKEISFDSDEEFDSDEDPTEGVDPLCLLINAKVYIIADKYNIRALKALATAKYKEFMIRLWSTAAFPESALVVLNNTVETDRMLRDVIFHEASKHVQSLSHHK